MMALLVISITCFIALYFAMLALLRHAAASGRALALQGLDRKIRSAASPKPGSHAPDLQNRTENLPPRQNKQPDWRFLVRDGRRPFPSGQTIESRRKPANPTLDGHPRSDWAHFNKDLGDLNDPYQALPSTARRA